MLFTGWKVCIVKNFDLGLWNAAWSMASGSIYNSEVKIFFFFLYGLNLRKTNVQIFFFLKNEKKKNILSGLHATFVLSQYILC